MAASAAMVVDNSSRVGRCSGGYGYAGRLEGRLLGPISLCDGTLISRRWSFVGGLMVGQDRVIGNKQSWKSDQSVDHERELRESVLF